MLRVLIVDDEPFIREGLRLLIDWVKEGYEVTAEARNAYECISILQKEQFDLILIDIDMPKMNGIELSKYIREKISRKVSIIFLTGYLEMEYVNEAFSVNAAQYLQKPVQPELLLQVLRQLRGQIELQKSEEQIRIKNARVLREYYLVELIHGIINKENYNYLKSLFRGEHEIQYIHFNLNLATGKEEQSDIQEEIASLKEFYQKRLKERAYRIITHISGVNERAIGYVITEKMLQEKNESVYELVDRILLEVPQVTKLRVVAKIGKKVDDIGKLSETYQDAMKAVAYTDNNKEIPLELRICSYIHAHYMENITLKSLSETFYVNAAYLGQAFKKRKGMFLKDYLNSIRVKKGAELLLNSSMKIYQIAECVGFQSADSFITAFSKEMNTTPQKFRQEKGKEGG